MHKVSRAAVLIVQYFTLVSLFNEQSSFKPAKLMKQLTSMVIM